MRRNKLYTVNKWNKPAFMPANYFDWGGLARADYNNQLLDNNINNSVYANAKNAQDVTNAYMNSTNAFGISKAANPFSKGNLQAAFSKQGLSNLAGGAMTAGLSMGSKFVGQALGSAIGGGLQSTAGNVVNTIGSAIPDTGTPLDYVKNIGVGVISGTLNRALGSQLNEEKIAEVQDNNAKRSAENDALYSVNNTDDLFNSVGNMTNATAFNEGDIGSDGWFSSDAEDKYDELKAEQERVNRMRGVAIGTATNKVNRNQYINRMKSSLGLGGNLFDIGGFMTPEEEDAAVENAFVNKTAWNTNLPFGMKANAVMGEEAFNNMYSGVLNGSLFADGGLKTTFMDEFGSDPIGAAMRYKQGLERQAAEEEEAAMNAAREAEYLANQQRLANLETQYQGLQAIMSAMPTNNISYEEIPTSSSPSRAAYKSSGNKNWDYIEDQLRKSGNFNETQIKGIKYNLQRESSINPDIVGDEGAAFGLAQWHGSRQPKDRSLEGQTKHLIETLSNFDGKEHWIGRENYEGFLNARTPEEAHYYIAKGYERPHKDIVAKVKRDSDMSLKHLNAFGGELGTNGADFTDGMIYIDEGGSHEENPLDGVPMGIDTEGIPNLVEEGETVYNDYVFSDRMNVPDFMLKDLGLPKSKKGISFADASKKLSQESEQRPNDPISKAGLDATLSRLAEIQETERMKQNAEEYTGLAEYACGGKIGKKYEGKGPFGQRIQIGYKMPTLPDYATLAMAGALPITSTNRSSNFDYGDKVPTKNNIPGVPAPTIKAPAYMPQILHAMDGDDFDGYIEGELDPNYVGEETRRETLPNGDTIIYHGRPKAQEQKQQETVVEENYNPYPTWMRYAPAIGNGVMALTDALGITNNPDYTYADKLEGYARQAGTAPHVGYKPIGNYLTYRPMDIWYEQNRMDANARATDRAITNNAAPIGTKMAGLLASGYNNQIANGQLYRSALEYNDARRKDVAGFNRTTDMFNSQMGLEAAMANARYQQAAKQMGLSGLAQAAGMRDAIDARVGAARSANLTNFLTSLGNIGRENFALNQINSDRSRNYRTNRKGVSSYKRKG